MIQEVAELNINPGSDEEFIAAVEKAVPLFQRAKGCISMRLEKVIETPSLYRLIVEWETLEDHTVHFRESDDFQQWRALAGPFFAKAPSVNHSTIAIEGF